MDDLYSITLKLNDLTQLFQEPEVNPFIPEALFTSGIETILNELKPSSLRKRTLLNIQLPADQMESDLQEQIQAAIKRYCQFRIHQNKNELSSLRWKGLKALQSGLIFLTTCLLLSALVDRAIFLPEFVGRVLSEGLIIVGWVSLWNPTEILLYEWWPEWRENQIFKHITDMEIKIEPWSAG
jgi:hypothetical protein